MGNVFGRKSLPPRVTEHDRAVLQMKQQRDRLKQYQKRITLQQGKERLLAKQLLTDGKKEKALLLLKKKQYQDQLLHNSAIQILNLEHLIQDIEGLQRDMKVIEVLKVGNDCLKSIHESMPIEDVERLLDETQDSIEYQRQIDEMLAGALTQDDKDFVLAELEALIQAEDAALPEVPTEPVPEVPDVPEAANAETERREAKKKADGEMSAA
ncbi:charged multivesicular body protein 6-like [Brachionichthys hirsutus]|uniref:charged multivesicular body protein 6-like n=1 Tax=Brachionichthys hirsutus TaxID=412623 RepID=UPI00360479E2